MKLRIKAFKCLDCNKFFETLRGLAQHYNLHKKGIIDDNGKLIKEPNKLNKRKEEG